MERSKLKTEAPAVFVLNTLAYAGITVRKPVESKKGMIFEIDKSQKADAFAVLKKKERLL